MTTEEDFQKALDANPTDWQTRLVFADWLQERGDERAEGYRALGVLRKVPAFYHGVDPPWTWWRIRTIENENCLAHEWWHQLGKHRHSSPVYAGNVKDYETRRTAEDAAALAFTKLSPERRHELLAGGAHA